MMLLLLIVVYFISLYDFFNKKILNWVNLVVGMYGLIILSHTHNEFQYMTWVMATLVIWATWYLSKESIMGGGDWKLFLALTPYMVAFGTMLPFTRWFLIFLSVQLVYAYILQLILKKDIPVPSGYLFLLALVMT